ncbi:MAG: twin-arginine translocase TatA/TatE family subunit [Bacteroidales bacterium]|nr:twin-arginine translocase TatA/TatE family subunit [Bacteroidales bacterium]
MGLSGGEILLVILVALMLFGAKSIPEIMRGIAKGMHEFRKAADEIKEELNRSSSGIVDEITELKNDVERQVQTHIQQPLSEIGNEIQKKVATDIEQSYTNIEKDVASSAEAALKDPDEEEQDKVQE